MIRLIYTLNTLSSIVQQVHKMLHYISDVSGHVTGMSKVAKSVADDVAIKSTNFLEPMRIGDADKKNTRHVQTVSVNNTTIPIISVSCVADEAGLCIKPCLKHCAVSAQATDDEARSCVKLARKRSSANMWMWSMLICMMQLCLQVTALIDASDKNTHFILQPNHIKNIAEMQPSYVQDVFVNDAAENLLN